MRALLPYLFLCITCAAATAATDSGQPQTEQEKLSYTLGVQVARNFLNQSITIDNASFVRAINDVLTGSEIRLSNEEMTAVLESFRDRLQQERSRIAETNRTEGSAFLDQNKARDGVVTLPSGLQYRVITQGSGPKPEADSSVVVNYRGTLINGKEFDSSYSRGEPATLQVNHVIAGWQEALQLMPVGSKWQIFVPAELAYGERAMGPDIMPNSTLIFDIELIAIK